MNPLKDPHKYIAGVIKVTLVQSQLDSLGSLIGRFGLYNLSPQIK
jgi:hypothetical protein